MKPIATTKNIDSNSSKPTFTLENQNKINFKTENELLQLKTLSLSNESDELKRMLLQSKLN